MCVMLEIVSSFYFSYQIFNDLNLYSMQNHNSREIN